MKTLLERIVVNFLGKSKEPPVAPKKTLLEQITEEFVTEKYTDAKKQQMGIPADAESRGGRWYRGDVYAGRVRDGKFIPASEEPESGDKETPADKEKQVDADLKRAQETTEENDRLLDGKGAPGAKGSGGLGLANEVASVDDQIVSDAEGAMGLSGTSENQRDQLQKDKANIEKKVCDHLVENERFMSSEIIQPTLVYKKKSEEKELTSTSKKNICKVAGTIVANRLLLLETQVRHEWDDSSTTTQGYMGSDQQLQQAADDVEQHVKDNPGAVLVLSNGERHAFYESDGKTPRRIKYTDKDGVDQEGTVLEVVQGQILNSGAGDNAGDTFKISQNSDNPGELMLHNLSNKTSLDDQISHSSPAQDYAKRKAVVDELEESEKLTKEKADKAREIMAEGQRAKQAADKALKTSTQRASVALHELTSDDEVRKAQLQHSWDNNVVPNKKQSEEKGWPDPDNDKHWRSPTKTEGPVGGARRAAIITKHGSLEGFMEAMTEQDKMNPYVGNPDRTPRGPTEDELKTMERMAGRFQHWSPDELDVPAEITTHRQAWVDADKAEYDALQGIRFKHTLPHPDGDIQIDTGVGGHVLGSETYDATHYHFADNEFVQRNEGNAILAGSSVTNNGGVLVDGQTLQDCMGIDHKTQLLAGTRRGPTTLQTDKQDRVTGLVVRHVMLVIQLNPGGDPKYIQKEVPIMKIVNRTSDGKMAKLSSLGSWSPEMQDCFKKSQGSSSAEAPKEEPVSDSVRPLLRSLIVRELDRIKNGN